VDDVGELAAAVDGFVEQTLMEEDRVLDGVLERGRRAGLPQIQVSAPQAKLLHLLARAIGAERVLEVGTLAGYSGIWLARALPESGRLVTIEFNAAHAEVARANFEAAGVADKVDLRVGAALDVLPRLEAEGLGPFDLSFIDADKPNNTAYLEWATRLSRPGGVIVLDNVVRGGAVLDRDTDANAAGAHDAVAWLGANPGLDSTIIQTVGAKGYDGFAIAVVG
jgi:predicted O-methyltransferase YrrM